MNIKMMCMAAVVWAGAVFGWDLSTYNPADYDAIRNGVMLSMGRTGGVACVELPDEHRAVTNVYDFQVAPANQDGYTIVRTQQEASYCYCTTVQATVARATAETLVVPYVVTDASRLDRTATSEDTQPGQCGLNSIVLSAGYAGQDNGQAPITALYRDVNRNGILDGLDQLLDKEMEIALAPGEALQILVTAVPGIAMGTGADTVTLTCSSGRLSPSGQRLTRMCRTIVPMESALAGRTTSGVGDAQIAANLYSGTWENLAPEHQPGREAMLAGPGRKAN
jgi:hypothetical protein